MTAFGRCFSSSERPKLGREAVARLPSHASALGKFRPARPLPKPGNDETARQEVAGQAVP